MSNLAVGASFISPCELFKWVVEGLSLLGENRPRVGEVFAGIEAVKEIADRARATVDNFVAAAQAGRVDEVKLLVQRNPRILNGNDARGWTALVAVGPVCVCKEKGRRG